MLLDQNESFSKEYDEAKLDGQINEIDNKTVVSSIPQNSIITIQNSSIDRNFNAINESQSDGHIRELNISSNASQ